MKVHKVELYVIDLDKIGAEELQVVLENTRYPNRCIDPKIVSIITKDIGEWHDEHPLNLTSKCEQAYRDLFKETEAE